MSDTPNNQKPSDTSSWGLIAIVVSTAIRMMLGFIGFSNEAQWGIASFLGALLLYLSPQIRLRQRFLKWLWICFCLGAFAAGIGHFLDTLSPTTSKGPTAPFF